VHVGQQRDRSRDSSPKRKLREGDIVSIDFGMEVDGYYADSAVTVPVGQIRPELRKLLDVTRESLDRAIDKMRAGNRLGDVGHAVQSWVEQNGFSVVREFVGHGIGTKMHDEPNLPNYGDEGRARGVRGHGDRRGADVNAGRRSADAGEWVATAAGSPSARFEHTVAVTVHGPWILQRAPRPVTVVRQIGLVVHLRSDPVPTNSRTTEKPFCSTQLCTAWPTSPKRLPARILSIARSSDSRVTSRSFRSSGRICPTGQ